MTGWKERRKKSGMTQFQLSKQSGITRMRLSLAETGQLELTNDEKRSLERALNEYIAGKAREIASLVVLGGDRAT